MPKRSWRRRLPSWRSSCGRLRLESADALHRVFDWRPPEDRSYMIPEMIEIETYKARRKYFTFIRIRWKVIVSNFSECASVRAVLLNKLQMRWMVNYNLITPILSLISLHSCFRKNIFNTNYRNVIETFMHFSASIRIAIFRLWFVARPIQTGKKVGRIVPNVFAS